jgi:hypothetical protein
MVACQILPVHQVGVVAAAALTVLVAQEQQIRVSQVAAVAQVAQAVAAVVQAQLERSLVILTWESLGVWVCQVLLTVLQHFVQEVALVQVMGRKAPGVMAAVVMRQRQQGIMVHQIQAAAAVLVIQRVAQAALA